uniref:Uncharacterized protein n=1 Tax=Octopus bimaculoides TaxID=37653 RepID=A0A0L8I3X3_OCTBM
MNFFIMHLYFPTSKYAKPADFVTLSNTLKICFADEIRIKLKQSKVTIHAFRKI